MDELDEGELFTVCLDDDGHPVLRTATDVGKDAPAGPNRGRIFPMTA